MSFLGGTGLCIHVPSQLAARLVKGASGDSALSTRDMLGHSGNAAQASGSAHAHLSCICLFFILLMEGYYHKSIDKDIQRHPFKTRSHRALC